MNGEPAEDEEAVVRRWISVAFGAVDPAVLMEAPGKNGRQSAKNREARSVIEEKVFIILQAALEEQCVSISALDRLARTTVKAVRENSLGLGPVVVEALLGQWISSPDRLAHAVQAVNRVASPA